MTTPPAASRPGPPARSESLRDLVAQLRSAQKSPVGVPAYMRFVNRRAGGYLAVLSHRLGLTPTQVTGVSAALSFAGIAAVALVRPSPVVAVLVALALALGFAFDSADGQLARLRGGGSPAGEWLDHVVDCVKASALHGAVAVSLYRFADLDHAALLLLPLLYTVAGGAHYFGMMLRDQLLRGAAAPAGTRQAPQDASLLRALLLLPLDHGLLCLVFVTLAVPGLFLTLYGLLLAGTTLFSVYSLTKAYRQLARPAAAPSAAVRAQPTAVG